MAITSYKAVVGYYNSAGTPSITTAVTGQLSDGWIPIGAPILTDTYGQCTQMMVKTDATPAITTSAYTVVTAANPQPPDATWDAQGEPLWIDTTTYLQAYTKGGVYLQGVVPVSRGGTGATNASGARINLGLGSVATLNTVPVTNGGTGSTNASDARANLGLGSVATLNNIPLANGGTGATNASDARTNLGLGSAATLNTGSNNGNAMRVGDFGLGKPDGAYVFNTTSQDTLLAGLSSNGLTVFRNNQQIAAPWDIWNFSPSLFFRAGDTFGMISIPYQSTGKIKVFSGVDGQGWTHSRTIYDTMNTTVDSNGFLKAASPIVKVFSDGRFETNEQSDGVLVERVSVGVYKISGVLGLNSEALWGGVNGGFEIPVDVNKQARIWLDYEIHADGSIVMKTYHRTHDSSPSFATNTIDGFNNGDPIDIPSDAFVSVRVNMP